MLGEGKTVANPMRPDVHRLREAPRCGARTRRGSPCKGPAVQGKHRCRMHGGAYGSGAPTDERHGHYKHGFWTKASVEIRSAAIGLIKCARSAESSGSSELHRAPNEPLEEE